MSLAYHCEWDSCDSWARAGSDAAAEFITATSMDLVWHFCTLHCLMHWAAAKSEPTEER